MSISISPEDKRKLRIKSSEALKSIMTQKRRIHRLFEKKIPRAIARSVKSKKKPSLILSNFRTETPFYIQTQSSPLKQKSSSNSFNEDPAESLKRRLDRTSLKFASWSKIKTNAARIRSKTSSSDIYHRALNTVLKEPKINSSSKKFAGPKVSRIVL